MPRFFGNLFRKLENFWIANIKYLKGTFGFKKYQVGVRFFFVYLYSKNKYKEIIIFLDLAKNIT